MRSIFVAGCALLLISCGDSIKGNGNVVQVTREVSNFQNLTSSGSIDVEIQPGDTYTVRIVDDENLIPYVIADVQGDELQIHYKKGVNIRNSHTKVIVSAPFLNNITTSGSGDLSSAGTIQNNKMIVLKSSGSGDVSMAVNTPALKISGAGSGDFKLSGDTKDLDCTISGSGNIDAQNLHAENAKLKIAGSGNAKVFASNTLSASIAGSGNILYWGNPSLSDVSVAGSGKVKSGE